MKPFRVHATFRLAGTTFVVTAVGTAFAFVAQMLVARNLGAAEYGYYAYSISWVLMLAVVAKLGWDTCSLRILPAAAAMGEWARYRGFAQFSSFFVAGLSIVISLLMAVAVAALWGRLDQGLRFSLLWASLLLPMFAFSELMVSWLQGLKKNVSAQLAYGIFRPIVIIASVATAVLFGFELNSAKMMAVNVVTMLMVMGLLVLVLKASWPADARGVVAQSEIGSWLKITLPLFAISLSQLALSRADVLIAGFYLDASSLGIYAAANQFAMLVTFGISTMNSVTAPMIAQEYARGDRKKLQDVVRLTSRIALTFTVPACVVLILFGKQILSLFGLEFAEAFHSLLVLSIGQLVIAIFGPVGFLLTMTAYQKQALIVICAAAVLQVALILILTPRFGIVGAATGSAIGNASRSMVLAWVVRRKLQISGSAF